MNSDQLEINFKDTKKNLEGIILIMQSKTYYTRFVIVQKKECF